jgi:hypothetical protein
MALAGFVALLQGLEVVAVAAAATKKESLASAEIRDFYNNGLGWEETNPSNIWQHPY